MRPITSERLIAGAYWCPRGRPTGQAMVTSLTFVEIRERSCRRSGVAIPRCCNVPHLLCSKHRPRMRDLRYGRSTRSSMPPDERMAFVVRSDRVDPCSGHGGSRSALRPRMADRTWPSPWPSPIPTSGPKSCAWPLTRSRDWSYHTRLPEDSQAPTPEPWCDQNRSARQLGKTALKRYFMLFGTGRSKALARERRHIGRDTKN